MSDYFGDIRLGDTIDIKFTTRQISGAPATLAGSPVISAYPANSTTQLTAGITLSVDFDAVTGYNNVRVVASGGNGYLTATNYDLCITTGTVNSVSVVGESIGSFSIENRSALMPTTAARTAAVDASGRVLSDVDTIKTNPVVNAGTVTFPTTATLASTTNITAGTITTVGTLTTYTGNTVQTGDNYARLGAPAGASVSADVAAVKAVLPTALSGGFMKSDVLALNTDATSAGNIAKTTRAIGRATASGVPTTTSIPTSACTPAGAAADQFKTRIITFDADTTTTALRGQATDITASSNSATPTFTVTALTTAPVSGDTFSIT